MNCLTWPTRCPVDSNNQWLHLNSMDEWFKIERVIVNIQGGVSMAKPRNSNIWSIRATSIEKATDHEVNLHSIRAQNARDRPKPTYTDSFELWRTRRARVPTRVDTSYNLQLPLTRIIAKGFISAVVLFKHVRSNKTINVTRVSARVSSMYRER